MAKVSCYTQRTTRGHELRRLRDDAFLRLATPDEIAASDEAATRDGGVGAFEADDETKSINVLSIDAWADGDDGWTWNNWHKVGTCPLATCDLPGDEIVAFMIAEGYLHDGAAARVEVDDDQCNMVIVDKATREPLFALEYGPASDA